MNSNQAFVSQQEQTTLGEDGHTTTNESMLVSLTRAILSKMQIYNSGRLFRPKNGEETLASADITPTFPSSSMETEWPKINVATLSESCTVLLVIRRYLKGHGCGFCNRRLSDLTVWYRSLLQLGVVPVIVHGEYEHEANEFFYTRFQKVPIIRDMLRVSDPYYDLSQQLFQTDPKCKPLTFKDPRSIGGFNVLKEYLRATKDGFKFETLAQHEVLGIGNKTNTLIPKMALIRNEHVFDQELQERAPDVVGTVVLSLPWLTANTEDNEKLEEWSQISSCSNSVGTSTAVNLREMEQMNDQLNALVHPNTQVSHHLEEGSMESKTCGHKEDFEQLQDKQEEVHQSRVYQEEETLVMNDSTPETTQPIPNTSAHPEPNLRDRPLHLVTTPEKNEESRADNLPVMVFDPSILSKNIQPVKKVKKKFEFEVITKERRISDENEQTAIAKKTLQKKKKKKHNCWSSATLSHAELEAKKEDFTLHTVLDSDAKRKYFKLFAFREHNAENIMFYEHVQRYKRIYQKTVECTNSRQLSLLRTTLEHKARTIAHDYLFDTDSLNLLNTTSKLTAVVAQKISMDGFFATKEAGVLFDPIVFEIMGTIMPDMFLRFSISQEFKEMIESLNPKRKASSRSL